MKKMDETLYKRTIYKRVLAGVLAILIAMTSTNADWNAMRYVHADDVGPSGDSEGSGGDETCNHDELLYISNDNGTHRIVCANDNCDYVVTEEDDCDNMSIDDDGTLSGVCSVCQFDWSSMNSDDYGIMPFDDEEDENRIDLYLVDKSGNESLITNPLDNGATNFEGTVSATYGEDIKFKATHDGEELSGLKVYYILSTSMTWNSDNSVNIDTSNSIGSEGTNQLDAGDYYLFFEAGDVYELGESEGEGTRGVSKRALRINKAKLDAVNDSTMSWDSDTDTKLGWDKVSTANDGTDLVTGTDVAYNVSVYFNDDAEPIYSTTDPIEDNYIDIATLIPSGKYGSYYVEISAIAKDTQDKNYDESEKVKCTVPYVHEDKTAPVIEKYLASVDSDGQIAVSGSAKDPESKITGYAFVDSNTTVDSSFTGWETVDIAADASADFDADMDSIAAGEIWFYVKNEFNHVSCQKVATDDSKAVKLSTIKLENYYVDNNNKEDYIILLLNDNENIDYVLPTETDMLRTGMHFEGWYKTSTPSEGDEAITAVKPGDSTLAKGGSVTLYAKWKSQDITFKAQPTGVDRVYDGSTDALTATIADNVTFDDIEWSWYYKTSDAGTFAKVEEGVSVSADKRSSSINVKNHSNSGIYFASVDITISGDENKPSASTSECTVKIDKRPLVLKIADREVNYNEELTGDFELELGTNESGTGLVAGEELSAVISYAQSNFSTDYTKGSDVIAEELTQYYIKYTGLVASDNYAIAAIPNGVLTVKKMDLTGTDKITYNLSQASFIYDGTAKEPGVSDVQLALADGTTKNLTQDVDYTISYTDNTLAGKDDTAVVLTFIGNFEGSMNIPFAITKGSYEVQTNMDGWKYGESANSPSVSDNKGGSSVRYYYLKIQGTLDSDGDIVYAADEALLSAFESASKENKTSIRPVDAGKYYVWAELDATDNYETVVAAPAVFEITRRNITLTSASQTWTYDGNHHTAGTYTQTGDGFATQEGFQYVTANGEIHNVGTTTNEIDYKLTSATKAENYKIVLVNGELKIEAAQLTAPSTFGWSASAPGTLEWIAITRDSLTPKYRIDLYRTTSNNGGRSETYEAEPCQSWETGATKINVLDFIHSDSASALHGYAATITVLSADNDNYTTSDPSGKTPVRYTAKLMVEKYHDSEGDDPGIESYSIRRSNSDSTATEIVAFEGESFAINATFNRGYEFGSVVYTGDDSSELKKTNHIKAADSTYLGTTVVVNSLNSCKEIRMDYKSKDSYPYFGALNAVPAEDNSYIKVDFVAKDDVGLAAYQFVKVASELAEGATLSCPDTWTSIAEHPTEFHNVDYHIAESGIYYLAVKDTAGTIRYNTNPIVVYKVSFDANKESGDAEHPVSNPEAMSPVFKLKGDHVILPAVLYERPGYGFTNWTGATGIYANQGDYVVNSDDTLKAGWTNQTFDYTVKYYYQQLSYDSDGNVVVDETSKPVLTYVEDDEKQSTYTAAYRAEIAYNDSHIRKDVIGYSLTSDPAGVEGYVATTTIDGEGCVVELYYNLNTYNLTYSYTDKKGAAISDVIKYYYGQKIVDRPAPIEIGYKFIGWNYGDSGDRPDTMPNSNITATGQLVPESTQYQILYYVQNLDQSPSNKTNEYLAKSFSLNGTMTEIVNAEYEKDLYASISEPAEEITDKEVVVARDIEGFTPVAVTVTYGTHRTYTDGEFDTFMSSHDTNKTGVVRKVLTDEEKTHIGEQGLSIDDGPTYICFYYTRNVYDLKMDVYKDAREKDVHLFGSVYDGSSVTAPNGEKITTDDGAHWRLPYGYLFASESDESVVGDESDGKSYKASYFETFGIGSKGYVTDNNREYSKAWTERWPTGEDVVVRGKYKLADFVDWSSGSTRPTSMPAGNVNITREYTSAEQAKYIIDVYVETLGTENKQVTVKDDAGNNMQVDIPMIVPNGSYKPAMSYEYYGEVGSKVVIADTAGSDPDTAYYTFDELRTGVKSYKQYEHNHDHDLANSANQEVLTNTITENVNLETGEGVMHLRVNLVRKEYTTYIRYYTTENNQNNLFAYTAITQKWGTTYFVDPLAYFDKAASAPAYAGEYEGANKTAFIHDSKYVNKDYRNGKYLVSYTAYRYIPDSETHTNPYNKFGTVTGNVGTGADYLYQTAIDKANAMRWIMGGSDDATGSNYYNTYDPETDKLEGNKTLYNYVNVYYSLAETNEHYTLRLKYEDHNSGKYLPLKISSDSEVKSTDGTVITTNPNGSAVDFTTFDIHVANRADIFNSTAGSETVPTQYSRYPGVYYTHNSEAADRFHYTDTGVLRDGFEEVKITYGPTIEHEGEVNDKGESLQVDVNPQIEGTFYLYKKADGSYDGKIYVADSANQFYSGNRTSYNYNSSASNKAHVGRDVFAATTNKPTSGRVLERDNGYNGLNNNGLATTIAAGDMPCNDYNAYYYDVYNEYYLTFIFNGVSCSGSPHDEYTYNQEVTDFTCNRFSVPAGYRIAWYFDEEHTKPVEPFHITGPTKIYGNREKLPVENWDYAFYRISERDDKVAADVDYITNSNVDNYTWTRRTTVSELTGTGFEVLDTTVDVPFKNGTIRGTRTTWYYNGDVVMSKTPHYTETFVEFTMDYSKYASGGLFGVDGYSYDEANTKNKSKAYCSATPVEMYAYFTRNMYSLTVRAQDSKNANDVMSVRMLGTTCTVANPVKEGYSFAGWLIETPCLSDDGSVIKDDEGNITYTEVAGGVVSITSGDGSVNFKMPAMDLRLTAKWESASIAPFVITHYLMDEKKTYKTDLFAKIADAEDPVDATATLNGGAEIYPVKKYDIDGHDVIKYTKNITIDAGTDAIASISYYGTGVDVAEDGKYNMETADLFAATTTVTKIKSEDKLLLKAYELENLGTIFAFQFATYQYDEASLILKEKADILDDEGNATGETDTYYEAYKSANVAYYYERLDSIKLRTRAIVAVDNADKVDAGLTLSGAGNHYYGENVTLYATMNPAGYSFKGWFKAADVFGESYTGVSMTEDDWNALEPRSDLYSAIVNGTISAESTDLAYPFVVKNSTDYVAVTMPDSAAKPGIKIYSSRMLTWQDAYDAAIKAGKNDSEAKKAADATELSPYLYQYDNKAGKNTLTAAVTWPEGAGIANSITKYQWYVKYIDISGMTAVEVEALQSKTESELNALERDSSWEAVPNSNSGTYNFPLGKEAGIYVYRCEAEVTNKSTIRHTSSQGTYLLTVGQCNDYYTTKDTEYTYAAKNSTEAESRTYEENFKYETNNNPNIHRYYSENAIDANITDEELTRRKNLAASDADKIYESIIEYKDVKVDSDKAVIPHEIHYLLMSEDKNYASMAGSARVKINPTTVTVSQVMPFKKYYDASLNVKGSSYDDPLTSDVHEDKRYIGNTEFDSDYKRLQMGTDLPDGQNYYRIDGILECDQNLDLVLDFKASFDSMHVNATEITLTDLWVAHDELTKAVDNYNYRFTTQTELKISAQIRPYPLEIKWVPTESSSASADYVDADYYYMYDGTELHPYIVITDEHTPDNKDNFKIEVRNAQKNVGTYNATAEVVENTDIPAESRYQPADYTFSLSKKQYKVLPRYIKVQPKSMSKVYNGAVQTLIKDESKGLDEFEFFTKSTSDGTWQTYKLPSYGQADGEKYVVSALPAGKDVGVYTNVGVNQASFKIIDSNNIIINDNYDITYGTGTLTILPCPVTVSGITAEDKDYDSTASATVKGDGVVFYRLTTNYDCSIAEDDSGNPTKTAGLYAGDSLGLDITKVSGTFVSSDGNTPDPKAGSDKTVKLTIDNSTADATYGNGGVLTGASSANYKLIVGDSDKYSQKTTTANILAGTRLTVSVADMTYTYGESRAYTDYKLSYTGFMSGDSATNAISTDAADKATFEIKKKNADGTYETVVSDGTADDMKSLAAGEYFIFIKEKDTPAVEKEADGLRSDNYTIVWDGQPARLTVKKRKIAIQAKEGAPLVEKDYSKTKTVEEGIITTVDSGAPKYYELTHITSGTAEEIAKSGVVAGDDVSLGTYSAEYDDENVTVATPKSGASKILVTSAVLSGAKAANYELVNTSFEVPAKINPITLTITVENIETVYGEEAPAYKYKVEGAITTEEAAIKTAISNNTTISCDYNATKGSENRHARKYPLTVATAYANANYDIVYKASAEALAESTDTYGYLTVKKRKVYYQAADETINYGEENPPTVYDGSFIDDARDSHDGFVYGEIVGTKKVNASTKAVLEIASSNIPIYTDKELTAEITSDRDVEFTCYETGTTPIGSTSVPGTYVINPANIDASGNAIYAQDYDFEAKPGVLTIAKFYIAIENVEVLGKIYDGTTAVSDTHKLIVPGTYSGYEFHGLKFTYYEGATSISDTADNIKTTKGDDYYNDIMNSVVVNAAYESADADENAKVNVYITLKPDSYLGKRYTLLTAENKDAAIASSKNNAITAESAVTQTETTAFILDGSGNKTFKAIKPRPLTLYPADASIKYGTDITITTDSTKTSGNYSIVKDVKPAAGAEGEAAAIGFITGESFDTIGFNLSSSVYATGLDGEGRPNANTGEAYTTNSDVGSYAMNIAASTVPNDGSVAAKKAKNYDISYQKGLLTVEQNTLAAPTGIKWDDTTKVGTIVWNSVSGIGRVEVEKYEIELFKDGGSIGKYYTSDNTSLSYDLQDAIRTSGAGKYTVNVTAIASKTNNVVNDTDYANVAERGLTGSSGAKYAVAVNLVYSSDTDTQNAITKTNIRKVYQAGGEGAATATYVVLAGESNVDIKYAWGRMGVGTGILTEYKTGYMVDSVTTTGAAKVTLGTATDSSATSGEYSNTIRIASDYASTSLTVTMKLKHRDATSTLVVNRIHPTDGTVMYGYTGEDTPKFEAVTTASDGADYDYTYSWYFKKGTTKYTSTNNPVDKNGNPITTTIWNGREFIFPADQKVINGGNGSYTVYCSVTATRRDNGETYTIPDAFNNVKITKAIPSGSSINITNITANAQNWVYGETRKDFGYTLHFEEMEPTHLEYKKSSESESGYVTKVPTDAGTYQVRAAFEGNNDYAAVNSDPVTYSIGKATLATPSNVTMVSSPTAPYGLVKWDKVDGPSENNGVSPKSSIDVEYEVILSKSPANDETNKSEVKKVTVQPSGNAQEEYDFTSYIKEDGKYYVTVQAKVKPRTSEAWVGQDRNNCNDSPLTEIKVLITIGANVTSNGTATASGYTKEYDGTPLMLSVDYSDASNQAPTYTWMKNGVAIENSNSATYSITYVDENATYSCMVMPHGKTEEADKIYSRPILAEITPRPVTITTAGNTWTYDGSPHAMNKTAGETLDYSIVPVSGDTVTAITMADSQTAVGTKSNGVTGLEITRHAGQTDAKVVFTQGAASNNNYTLTVTPGTLSVTARTLGTGTAYTSGITVDDIADRTYNSAQHKPSVTVKDSVSGSAVTLVEGKDYTVEHLNNVNAENKTSEDIAPTVKITGKGNYSGSIIKTYTINPRELGTDATWATNITIDDINATNAVAYTGSEHKPEPSVKDAGLVDDSGNPKSTVTLVKGTDYTITGYANNTNQGTATITYTGTGNYTGSITKNFNITKIAGSSLSIADISDITYDGSEKKPALTVTDTVNNRTLALGVDYTVVYTDNINAADKTSASAPTATITGIGNYEGTLSKKFTIKPKNLNDIADASGKTYAADITVADISSHQYDGTNYEPGVTVNFTALKNADGTSAASTVLSATSDYSVTYANQKNAAQSTSINAPTVTITGNGNYTGTIVKTYTITPKPVELTWTGDSNGSWDSSFNTTYTGRERSITAAVNNAVSGDTVIIATYTGNKATNANSGSQYTAQATGLSGAQAGNYTLTGGVNLTQTWSIGKATQTISLSGTTVEYDATTHTITATASGLSGGSSSGEVTYYEKIDGQADVALGTSFTKKEAGTYTIYAKAAATNDYEEAVSSDVTLVITKRPIKITAKSDDKTYDGSALSNDGYDATYNGSPAAGKAAVVGSDALDATSVTVTGSQTNAGSSTNSINTASAKIMRGETDVTANYEITPADGTLTVNPLPVVIAWSKDEGTWTEFSTVYNNTSRKIEASVANKIGSDDVEVSTYEDNEKTAKGDYIAKVTALAGAAAANYTLTGGSNLTQTWSITKATRTITASDISDTYDGTAKELVAPTTNGAEDTGTITVTYAPKTGSPAVVAGKPVHAGEYIATINVAETDNYNAASITKTVTIGKRDIQIKSADQTWTYDGDTHYYHEFVTDSNISKSGTDYIVTATGDKLTATFTGQIRDVQYSNGAVTTVDNTYNNVKFTNSDSAVGDTTGDYNITIQSGKLKINPYDISIAGNGTLKLNDLATFPVEVAYHNGHLAGPSYGVTAQIKSGTDTVLVETRDFVITDDAANNKQKQAIYPDTYTIEVTGKGNYTGTLTGTYTIKDSAKPEISGGTEKKHISLTDATHNVFCKEEPEIRIADQTLANVTITAVDKATNSSSTYANDSYDPKTASKVDGKVVATYTLPGSDTGIEYTIVATDMSGTVSDTVKVTVYSNHEFTTYTPDAGYQEKTAPCNHNCGETDTRVLTHVTVKWDYNFVYDVVGDENPHTGVQEHLARATFAKVELLQNDIPIATQIVDCNSTCSVSDEQSTGEASITFEKYKPGNATAKVEEADTLIPKYDDNGEEYDYIVRVTPMKKIGDSLSSADADYHVEKTEGPTGVLPGHYEGVIALIQYGPNLFDVNWRVELTGLPTVNGHTVVPDALYVKVLYAYGPNADDSETISGYQIVSQQAGDSGTYCHVNHVDGKAVYTGKFPVWQRIPGTNDSYYHRIQVVGYRYHNVDYDVKSQNLKSINDSDHVNHTIYHVGNGVASGVIKYELGNLQLATPVVMLDHNPGNDTTNVITGSPNYYVVTNGGDVTAEQLTAAEPLRNSTYYDFLGWFDAKTGGSKVTELTSVTEDKRLYAHWKEKVAPNATIHAGDVSWSSVTDVSDPDDPDSKHVIKTNVITVDAYDNGLLGGIQTGVNNSGVSKVYYYKSTTEVNDFETTIADGDWVSAPLSGSGEHVTASINLGANGYYLIYLKIVDEDGNVTYLNSDGITVDKPAPVPQTPSGDKPSGDTPSGGLPQVKPTEAPAPTLPAKPELPTPGKQPVQPVQPVQPMITPIPETPGKTETPEQGKEEDDNAGKLVVKAERVEREETKPTEHLHTAELPDKDAVANAVLTEEEWKILDDGGEITIRLLIDDAKQVEDEKALEKTLEGLLDQMKLPEEEKKDKKVVFKSYVDLRLEKKVNDSDWERLLSSGEEIQVVINIPENLKQEGVPLYLAKADGSGYILIEDLDDNPDTITFMTDDFDSDYMIVSIGENKVPLADLFLPENNDCFWHWIILLMLILSAVTAIIWWKKEDEEEDETAAAAVENEEDDDRRKVRRKGHFVLLILFNGVGAICVYFGSCRLDLPFEIVSILLSAIIELAKGYKNRDVRRDENRN